MGNKNKHAIKKRERAKIKKPEKTKYSGTKPRGKKSLRKKSKGYHPNKQIIKKRPSAHEKEKWMRMSIRPGNRPQKGNNQQRTPRESK